MGAARCIRLADGIHIKTYKSCIPENGFHTGDFLPDISQPQSLMEIIPQEIHIPLEEWAEVTAHLMFVVASLIASWRRTPGPKPAQADTPDA